MIIKDVLFIIVLLLNVGIIIAQYKYIVELEIDNKSLRQSGIDSVNQLRNELKLKDKEKNYGKRN